MHPSRRAVSRSSPGLYQIFTGDWGGIEIPLFDSSLGCSESRATWRQQTLAAAGMVRWKKRLGGMWGAAVVALGLHALALAREEKRVSGFFRGFSKWESWEIPFPVDVCFLNLNLGSRVQTSALKSLICFIYISRSDLRHHSLLLRFIFTTTL